MSDEHTEATLNMRKFADLRGYFFNENRTEFYVANGAQYPIGLTYRGDMVVAAMRVNYSTKGPWKKMTGSWHKDCEALDVLAGEAFTKVQMDKRNKEEAIRREEERAQRVDRIRDVARDFTVETGVKLDVLANGNGPRPKFRNYSYGYISEDDEDRMVRISAGEFNSFLHLRVPSKDLAKVYKAVEGALKEAA